MAGDDSANVDEVDESGGGRTTPIYDEENLEKCLAFTGQSTAFRSASPLSASAALSLLSLPPLLCLSFALPLLRSASTHLPLLALPLLVSGSY
mgnify:CR=1 FL=1